MGDRTRLRSPASALVCSALAALGCDRILGLDDYDAASVAASNAASSISVAATGGGGAVSAQGGGGAAPSYADVVKMDDPTAYWRLGEQDGGGGGGILTANDEIGTIDAWYIGVPTLGVPGLVINDSDTAVRLGDLDNLWMGDNFGFHSLLNFTIELWIRPAHVDGSRTLVRKSVDDGNGYQGWQISIEQDSYPSIRVGRWLDGNVEYVDLGPINEEETSYVVGTYDGANLCAYLNDLEPMCVTSTFSIKAHSGPFEVGNGGSPGNFSGIVDEVAVYSNALLPARIQAHYLAGTQR